MLFFICIGEYVTDKEDSVLEIVNITHIYLVKNIFWWLLLFFNISWNSLFPIK